MATRLRITKHVLVIGSAAFVCACPAFAQTASQITPQTFAPPVQSGSVGGVAIGESPGLRAPAGAEKLFVTLSDVRVDDGGLPALAGEEDGLRKKFKGARISGAAIFAAAQELEAAYAKAGYVLARVTLPPQELVNGAVLRLVVVDGFIERIVTKGVSNRVRQRVADLLGPLTGVHGLKLTELERRILLAGDTPGVALRTTLTPGSTIGATVLVVDAKYQPVVGTLTADNSLPAGLARYQIGVGADFNGALGFGELIYLRATGDPEAGTDGFFSDKPRNRILAAGFIAPLGIDGLTFNVEGTQARTTPVAVDGVQSTDQFQRLSLRLRYPWTRSRDFNSATQLIFDAQDERRSLLIAPTTLPVSEDRLRVLRIANEADCLASWGGAFSAALTASFGLDALGARTAAEASPLLPLSRQGADATFSKLDGALSYSQGLAEHLTANVTVRAQTSFGSPLEQSEQIGLAGPGALSAFDAGAVEGDSGMVARGELVAPFTLPTGVLPAVFSQAMTGVGIVASPYAFAAIGEVFLEQPTALEEPHVRAASFGLGLRLNGGLTESLNNGSVTLEFARQARSDGAPSDNRFILVATIKF